MVMMYFPEWHFPNAPCPHGKTRALFGSLGTPGGLEVQATEQGIHTIVQRQTAPHQHLSAKSSAVPILPPNPADLSLEPCIAKLLQLRHDLHNLETNIRVTTGMIKKNEEWRCSLRQFLSDPNASLLPEECPSDEVEYSLPTRVQRLALEIKQRSKSSAFVPCVNSAYTGGCLSACRVPGDQDEALLALVRGRDLDRLYIGTTQGSSSSAIPQMAPVHVKRVNGPILQVENVALDEKVYTCARLPYKTLLTVTDWTSKNTAAVDRTWKKYGRPTDITLSPYIPGEHVVALDTGQLHLMDVEGRSQLAGSDISSRFPDHESWLGVSYAAHPRQLAVADRTGMAIYDIRAPSAHTTDIFTLPSRYLKPNERVFCAHTVSHDPFYHVVATNYSLLLMDQRMPNYPVMQQCHTLHTPPQYMTSSPLRETTPDWLLLVASQESAEVQCLHMSTAGSGGPPVIIDTPWKLSRPDDMMLLSPENLCVQPLLLEQRLRVPLVGIAGITSTRDLNFSTFQLTSQGDLFYQSFAPSSIEQDRTLAAGPGSKDLPVAPSCVKQWTQWAGEAQALEDVKWLSQLEQAKFLVPKKEDDFIVVNPEPVKKYLQQRDFAHVLCRLCMPKFSETADEPESGHCMACGNSLIHGIQMDRAAKQGTVVSCEEEVSAEEVIRQAGRSCIPQGYHTDAESLILEALWRGEEDSPEFVKLLAQREDEVKKHREERRQARKLKQSGGVGDTASREQLTAGGDACVEESASSSEEEEWSEMTPDPDTPPSTVHSSIPTVTDPITTGQASPEFRTPASLPEIVSSRQRHQSTSSVSSITSVESLAPGFLTTPPRLRKENSLVASRRTTMSSQGSVPASPLMMSTRADLFSIPSPLRSLQAEPTPSISLQKRDSQKSSRGKGRYSMGF